MENFIYVTVYVYCESFIDNREIATRRRNSIVFKVIHSNHYKFDKNLLYRGIGEWNSMDVHLSLIDDEIKLREPF